jgi:hypothetical protein
MNPKSPTHVGAQHDQANPIIRRKIRIERLRHMSERGNDQAKRIVRKKLLNRKSPTCVLAEHDMCRVAARSATIVCIKNKNKPENATSAGAQHDHAN